MALEGLSIGVSALSTIGQMSMASQTADMQDRLLRDQQTQLRISQASRSVDRLTQLQHVMATQAVTEGARGVAPSSGNVKGIEEESFQNAESDQRADNLNFMNQQNNIEYEKEGVGAREDATDLSALSDFGRNAFGMAFKYEETPGSGLLDSANGDSHSDSNFSSLSDSPFNLNQ